jgi:hypothetical protein
LLFGQPYPDPGGQKLPIKKKIREEINYFELLDFSWYWPMTKEVG